VPRYPHRFLPREFRKIQAHLLGNITAWVGGAQEPLAKPGEPAGVVRRPSQTTTFSMGRLLMACAGSALRPRASPRAETRSRGCVAGRLHEVPIAHRLARRGWLACLCPRPWPWPASLGLAGRVQHGLRLVGLGGDDHALASSPRRAPRPRAFKRDSSRIALASSAFFCRDAPAPRESGRRPLRRRLRLAARLFFGDALAGHELAFLALAADSVAHRVGVELGDLLPLACARRWLRRSRPRRRRAIWGAPLLLGLGLHRNLRVAMAAATCHALVFLPGRHTIWPTFSCSATSMLA